MCDFSDGKPIKITSKHQNFLKFFGLAAGPKKYNLKMSITNLYFVKYCYEMFLKIYRQNLKICNRQIPKIICYRVDS